MRFQPRKYQTDAAEAAWSYLHQVKSGKPLISLPTGSGKSWVIAMLVAKVQSAGGRSLVLAHRKELLWQNHEKIDQLAPVPVGIYSAGLARRDTDSDHLVAGIQSVYDKAEQIGERNVIIVDEAHMISRKSESMYSSLFDAYPDARVIGLTATPYRTTTGPLAGIGRQFSKLVYTGSVRKLIDDGYLSQLTTVSEPHNQVSTKGIGKRGNEFILSELATRFGNIDNVTRACTDIVSKTTDRKSVLVFCCSVDHAELTREILEKMTGQRVGCVTGGTISLERDATLRDFQSGALKYVVNCDVLTTGFDSPRIDTVCCLRSTCSPGLWCQIVGRGLRTMPGKTDCLILDYGSNVNTHGPFDSDDYGRCHEGDGTSAARNGMGFECPGCGELMQALSRECLSCGFVIDRPEPKARHDADAATAALFSDPGSWWEVDAVGWNQHYKGGNPDNLPSTLKVSYSVSCMDDVEVGNMARKRTTVSEWVCFEHKGFPRNNAVSWWEARSDMPIPATVREAMESLDRGGCRQPHKMQVSMNGAFPNIGAQSYKDPRPDSDDVTPHSRLDWDDCPF